MVIAIIFVIYIGIMLGVGAFFMNKNEKIADYILGGRSLNVWVAALSAQASDMSGWLLTGLPGLVYLSAVGSQEAIWTAIGLALGTYLNWLFVAKRLRQYTEISGNSLTMPDYFEHRFRDNTRILRIVTALFILIFFLVYTSSAFVTAAKLFQTVFGLSYTAGLFIGAAIVILYTCFGGFKAVCWTDLFQGIMMFIAIIIIPMTVFKQLGGFENAVATANAVNPGLLDIIPKSDGSNISWFVVITGLGWGLGYFGQPHILARFMGIQSSKQIRPARIIAMVWVVIALAAAILVGIAGIAYFEVPLADGAHETVFMELAKQLFNPIVAGVLLSAILAATMSTADSQLLVTASAISEDVYKSFINPKATDKSLINISRFTVVVVALIAVIIAFNPNSSIFGLVSYAWAGFGAAFGPTIIMSLYWRRMTKKGAIAGVVSGGVVAIVWISMKHLGGIFNVYEIVPGFIVSLICIVAFSLMDAPPEQEILDEFDSIKTSEI